MNIRQIALRILDEYEAGGKFINLALSTHLTDGLSREEKGPPGIAFMAKNVIAQMINTLTIASRTLLTMYRVMVFPLSSFNLLKHILLKYIQSIV